MPERFPEADKRAHIIINFLAIFCLKTEVCGVGFSKIKAVEKSKKELTA